MELTTILAALALAVAPFLTLGMVGVLRRIRGSGLQPAIFPEKARTDYCQLPPGTYPAGTVIAQLANVTARNDVQTVVVANGNAGVTYNLLIDGALTGSLAYNANIATVQTSLLTALGTVYGTSLVSNDAVAVAGNSSNYTVTSGGNFANMPRGNLSAFVAVTGTGNAAASVTISHTTIGQYAGGGFVAYDDTSITVGANVAKGVLQYPTAVNGLGQHQFGGGEWTGGEPYAPYYGCGYFRTIDLTGIDAAAVADMGRMFKGTTGNLSDPGAILQIGG